MKPLRNKPIVEAFFEIRWELKKLADGVTLDETYPLRLPGFYKDFFPNYQFNEPLSTAQLPDQIAGHVVKHRLRKSQGGYPLVQLGPGVASFNMGADYEWEEFEKLCGDFIRKLLDGCSEVDCREKSKYNSTLFRCMNALELDLSKTDFQKFAKEMLNADLTFPSTIYQSSGNLGAACDGLGIEYARKVRDPSGLASIRIASGYKLDKPAIIWELTVNSIGDDVPQTETRLLEWLDSAHKVVESWFFSLMSRDLAELLGAEE